jgi:hypothetical protein
MLNKNLPLPRAFFRLQDLARTNGLAYVDTQALTWLATARLYAKNRSVFTPSFSLDDLVQEAGWQQIVSVGLSPEAAFRIHDRRAGGLYEASSMRDAISVIKELCKELDGAPDSAWDVLPFIFSSDKRHQRGLELFISQPLVELLVDMLKGKSGSVWTPFDASGQIAITAFRRGYDVHTASITGYESITRHLLTCIETGSAKHPKLITEIARDERGRPILDADFIIADPPFGHSVREGQWGQWEKRESDGASSYDRAEAWTITHLLQRAKRQLILFSSQNWLFSTGQERRLREALIEKSNIQMDSVVTIPAGAFSSSYVASAIASFGHGIPLDAVRMTDVKSEDRADTIESLVDMYRPAILGSDQPMRNSQMITRQAIREADYVLLPQRHFRAIGLAGVNAVPLGEICIALRPPTPYRSVEGRDVLEIGIPNLREGLWLPIAEPDHENEKWVVTNPSTRYETFLSRDDIVLSVKGTLGLARLVSDFFGPPEGDDQSEWVRSVVSTSCIALRLSKDAHLKGISPRYLLMYLRSGEGQEQIRSLQVGAGMPHISIQTLMSAVRIPIPSEDDHAAVIADFEKLCTLEESIALLRYEMETLSESRWVVKLA